MRGLFVVATACAVAAFVVAVGPGEARAPSSAPLVRPVPSLTPATTAKEWRRLVRRPRLHSFGTTTDCRPLRTVFYAATDWLRLATKLAGSVSPCAHYYISVPPLVADKTQPRADQAWRIRALGPNFHALSEVHMGAWGNWVSTTGSTWYAAGVEARRRMAIAGYDVALGDSWAVNEFSSAVRRGDGVARANARQFVRGLHDGDGSLPQTRGAVFITGMSQPTVELSVYQARLQDWLEDPAFWTDMSAYVSDWSQELYGDVRNYAVPGAPSAARRDALNEYLQHELKLARVGPDAAAAARTFLERAYSPLANAAWTWDAAFGWTAVSVDLMKHYVSAQVYGLRHFSVQAEQDHAGFAWAPKNLNAVDATTFANETGDLLDRLAAAIRDSGAPVDPADPGIGACGPPAQNLWCAGDLDGALFNDGWKTFSAWKPSVLAFASAPQSIPAGTVSSPLAVELRTHTGVPLSATQPIPVTLTSSSSSGSFSTSPLGPWTSSLASSIAVGATRIAFYYRDTTVGAPVITAAAAGKTSGSQTQTVTVNARVTSVAYARPKHELRVTVSLVDGAGSPLVGVGVSATIARHDVAYASRSGTTDAYGRVTFSLWRPPPGCYATAVTSVAAPGWDGATPTNGICF